MAKTANKFISLRVTDNNGQRETLSYLEPMFINTQASGDKQTVFLSSGDNILSPPSNCKGLIIVAPDNSSVVLKLKGAAGDTGITIRPDGTQSLEFSDSGPGTIIINAASSVTVELYWH